ncbi:hypothetical protein Godav_014950, partial [Gossypium davidsonii]|nr:hypothetical protein [Gossypium davidsonii]
MRKLHPEWCDDHMTESTRRKAEKRKADRSRSREFRRKQRKQRSRIAGRRKKKGEGRRNRITSSNIQYVFPRIHNTSYVAEKKTNLVAFERVPRKSSPIKDHFDEE